MDNHQIQKHTELDIVFYHGQLLKKWQPFYVNVSLHTKEITKILSKKISSKGKNKKW